MPDITGCPQRVFHSVISQLQENKMDKDVSKSSWVSHNAKLSHEFSEEDDLQKAIELSLQVDSSQSRKTFHKIQQNDLTKALAVSINEVNQNTEMNKSSDVIGFNSNLHKSLYKDWPAGLCNVGNTCWFNVVVQSLFHIPSFRSLILKFNPTSRSSTVLSEINSSFHLIQELQFLFEQMLGSNHSVVDPSRLVSIFQDSTNPHRHEDASEFIHILLDRLEEAFRHQTDEKQTDLHVETMLKSNPMRKMFYGSYMSITSEGDERQHTFSIFPLCVENQLSLHRSLHQATSPSTSDGHEIWFKMLPPVLIFQLSRFHFNQQRKVTEKIHDRFPFPSVVYMDRYLEENKEIARAKREEAKMILSDLNILKSKLNDLINYPASSSRFMSLSDALSCCAQFASEIEMQDTENSIASSRRCIGSRSSIGLSPCEQIKDGCSELTNLKSSVTQDEVFSQSLEGPLGSPLNLSAGVESIESVLRRWKLNVDLQVKELQERIAAAQVRLERLFDEPHLHLRPYSLHAVLVHQGEAFAGHYWVYVRDHQRECWLKLNDTSVTQASFEQVISDSVGGSSKLSIDSGSSAYCLMYINSKDASLIPGSSEVSSDNTLSSPIKLGNKRMDAELEKQKPKGNVLNIDGSSTWDLQALDQVIKKVSNNNPDMAPGNALEQGTLCPVFQSCLLSIIQVSDIYNLEGVQSAINQAVRYEYNRLVALSQESPLSSDCRLISEAAYLISNKAKRSLSERLLLKQFSDPRLTREPQARDIMMCASSMLDRLPLNAPERKEHQEWHDCYVTFRTATYHLIEGLKKFQKRLYYDALRHLVVVHKHNKRLVDDTYPNKQVKAKFVASYGRACVQRVHDEVFLLVGDEDHSVAHRGLALLRSKLIPCMSVLISSDWGGGNLLDLQLADTIRDQWCSLIEAPSVLSHKDLSEALSEFLDANLFPSCPFVLPDLGDPPSNLLQLYEDTMMSLQRTPA